MRYPRFIMRETLKTLQFRRRVLFPSIIPVTSELTSLEGRGELDRGTEI